MSELIWLLIFLAFAVPVVQQRVLFLRRMTAIRHIEREHGSRVITLIHRQEALALLGFPLVRYIDIEDSESVLGAIHLTDDDIPIQLVIHTPGGLVIASTQIAQALSHHPAKVQVIVPYLAMSGGSLIALAADEIVMGPNAVIGPVDPQVSVPGRTGYPAASVLDALETPNPNRDDSVLIMGDMARKAREQMFGIVRALLSKTMDPEQAEETARMLSEGRWTHDYAIDLEEAREMGLPVTPEFPDEVVRLMRLYPQAGKRKPGGVEFIPVPYEKKQK